MKNLMSFLIFFVLISHGQNSKGCIIMPRYFEFDGVEKPLQLRIGFGKHIHLNIKLKTKSNKYIKINKIEDIKS